MQRPTGKPVFRRTVGGLLCSALQAHSNAHRRSSNPCKRDTEFRILRIQKTLERSPPTGNIFTTHQEQTDLNIDFWDQRFSEEGYAYGEAPNVFLQQQLPALLPGRILFPAEGQGRNAVYAAELGWDVVAFDPSRTGREKALALAADRGVSITYQLADFEAFYAHPETFDCIALIYAHMAPVTRQVYHRKFLGMLKKGGTLILEGFSKRQLGKSSGGPQDLGMLFSEKALREDFAGMSSLMLESLDITLSEGKYHQGPGSVIRAIGVK